MIKNYSPNFKKIGKGNTVKVLFLFAVVFFLSFYSVYSQEADLSITKTLAAGSPTNPKIGDEITFNITIRNAGPDVATGVTVQDEVPGGYYDITNVSNGVPPDNGVVTWTGLTIPVTAADDSNAIVLTLTVTVDRDGEYENRAQITASDQDDPDSVPYDPNRNPQEGFDDDDLLDGIPDDDEASITVVPATADLSITKTVSDATPNVGDQIEFVVSVTNSGPDVATNVSVIDFLPSGYSNLVSISNGGGVNASDFVLWENLTIGVGQTINLNFFATVEATGEYNNRAEIINSDQNDPNSSVEDDFSVDDLADGLPDDDETDYVVVTPIKSDLAITKDVTLLDANLVGGRPHKGTSVVFTITVTNTGTADTQNVTVLDQLPSGYIYVSDDGGGDYNATTGVWTIGDLDDQEVASLNITAIIGLENNYINTASITNSDGYDPDTTNNTASVTIDPVAIFIPQGFSPNDDNINDTFELPGLGALYPNFKLEIYNRWGNKVYDYDNNGRTQPVWWDGYANGNLTFNGSKKVPTGTYYYVIYFNQDNEEPISNWVYLNR